MRIRKTQGVFVLAARHQHDLVAALSPGMGQGVLQQRVPPALIAMGRVRHHVLDDAIGAAGAREVGDDGQRAGRDQQALIPPSKVPNTRVASASVHTACTSGPEGSGSSCACRWVYRLSRGARSLARSSRMFKASPRDVLHNSLRSVIARPRAVRCIAFFANSSAIGCKKTPCGLSRSALPPTREGYAGHP